MKLTREAHAKLNLFLEVIGKRADGHHELFSLVVFLDLADEITVEPARQITVSQTNGDAGITDNIIYKTAAKLAKKYKVKSGAKITFAKNIPISAGLGGGSADAAVTLVLLNTLWNLNLSHEEMYATALDLGADVPVCLYSILENANAAVFKGIGEVIEPAPKLPKMFFTLVNPAVELATKDVFAKFKYDDWRYEALNKKGDLLKNIITRSNDLEPAAIELVPQIAAGLDELQAAKNCRLARMTGSGATSFGIFKTRRDARATAVALIKKHPTWQIGPVGLKKISAYGKLEKIKRPMLKPQIRALKSLRILFALWRETLHRLNIKTFSAQNFSLSTFIHIFIIFFLGGFFIFQKYIPYKPKPEYITVAFSVEKPVYNQVLENDYEPASGGADEDEEVLEPPPVIIKSEKPPQLTAKPPAQKEIIKPSVKKPAAKLGASGSKNGNTAKPAKPAVKDYLELLQYTLQQRSAVPDNDSNLKGRAVLHLAFNRQGYVLAYALKTSTGSDILDKAAEKVAKNLMSNPFPPAPWNFDLGVDVLEYDFVISYPPHSSRL